MNREELYCLLGKIDCLKRSVARRKETCTIVYRGHSFDDEWTIVEKFYRFEFISFPIGKTFRRRNNCVRKQPREKYTDFRIRSICKLLLLLLASSGIIYLKFSNWNVWRRFLYYIFVLINFRKASAFFKIFVKILYFYRQSWTFQFFKSFVLCKRQKLSNFLTSSSFQTFNCLLLFFFFFQPSSWRIFKMSSFQAAIIIETKLIPSLKFSNGQIHFHLNERNTEYSVAKKVQRFG